MHTDRTGTTKRRGATTASARHARGGGYITQRGGSEWGAGELTGGSRMRKTGERFMFSALHLAACSGSGVQFLVIFCLIAN